MGKRYYLGRQVPTNSAMGQYAIIGNADVFGSDAGTYEVDSLDLLKIRLSEISAIAVLDNVSNTAIFTKEVAASAAQPIEDAAQMAAHPMDPVTGLPGGIGELFGRVSLGAGELYSTATNNTETEAQRASQATGETANITLTALGYDQLRRQLAHKLRVDPYSSNPILMKKLNHVAWVMFSAHMMVDTAISVAAPGSMLITGVQVTDDLIYQTPKADLILLVESKLRQMGLSSTEIAAFSHNPAIPLSLQVTVVRGLETLGPIQGRWAVVVALSNMLTEYQARFMVTSLRMLNQRSEQNSSITQLQVHGILVGHDQNGRMIMPAPVDYSSWTRIAGFGTDRIWLGMHNRVLWVAGKTTPLAHRQLIAKGWTLQEGFPLQSSAPRSAL